MQQVAITAAILASAFILAPAENISPASLADAPNINNIVGQTDEVEKIAEAPAVKSPARAELASATVDVPQPEEPKVIMVSEGDSLNKIAAGNGTTAERIYAANTALENPNLIFPGQFLKIPTPTEELAPRPMPEAAPVVAAAPQNETSSWEESDYVAPTRSQPVASTAPSVGGGGVWDSLAQCESGGNWAINTGNGYYGGLQFTLSTWQSVGGSGYPHEASREEQIMRAEILLARSGWGQWPACTSKLGLR